jgi:hypothetical protein
VSPRDWLAQLLLALAEVGVAFAILTAFAAIIMSLANP